MYLKIKQLIQDLNINSISNQRQTTLQPLIEFIQSKVTNNEEVRLNFICTHNSRRSHLTQIWAQVMAHYYSIPNVVTYSGGTEATAMFIKVAEILKEHGFEILALSEGKNPIYAIKFNKNTHPIIGFSKTYNHAFNPTTKFAAIMTCSQADAGCPFIVGAEKRIPITFDDPKAFDNTPQQTQKYNERSLQIATELCYVFSKIKK